MAYKKPIISVIISVYNQEKYIGRCLRSLLDQTLPENKYEIIIVDDGSTDKTPYALKLFCDFKNSIVKVLTNNKNLGLPSSLNRAIRKSKAKYIVRVDSDDFVNENFLNFLLIYLETNPKIDAVACDYLTLDDKEIVLERKNCMKDPIACGILFNKKQLENIGLYDENFLLQEEKELRIRFEKRYKIDHLQIPLYRYRRHETNMTNNKKAMLVHKKQLMMKHKS